MPRQRPDFTYTNTPLSNSQADVGYPTILNADHQSFCETKDLGSQVPPLATDAQQSTANTVSKAQTSITYNPYGKDNCSSGNPLLPRFNGYCWLPSSIGYFLGNGHRLFNPCLMRFHSADSLSPFENGGINSYAYCNNDPINRSDPSGMFSIVKFFSGGYNVKKIAPRLDRLNPHLTKREYRILKKHISTQKMIGLKEANTGKGEEIILEATLQESILEGLTPVKRKGKTRYTSTTDATFWEDLENRFEAIKSAGRRNGAPLPSPLTSSTKPSMTWPRARPPSDNFRNYTGNFIDNEVYNIRVTD